MTVGVPSEVVPGERRVALVPEVVGRLAKKQVDVVVERSAGEAAYYSDEEYRAQGAGIGTRAEALAADVVVKVHPPDNAEIGAMREGAVFIGFLNPLDRPEIAGSLAERGVTAISMELVPRISRAQKMDALSAMSSVAGYRAVLLAAGILPRFFPLLTTAAGTVKPANVLVLGAGVAGLQAIATARRLGGRVSAYDVRDVVREEIQSLGAVFVELDLETQTMQDAGGYAKALSEDRQQRQIQLLAPHVARSDVVITTALVPGRPAPVLIDEEAVVGMSGGSVIVDLAAQNGGNCMLTRPGETVTMHDVTIAGPLNLPAEMPVHASQMYARTLMAMILEFASAEGFKVDFEDEIFRGACITHGGEVVNERVKSLLVSP